MEIQKKTIVFVFKQYTVCMAEIWPVCKLAKKKYAVCTAGGGLPCNISWVDLTC